MLCHNDSSQSIFIHWLCYCSVAQINLPSYWFSRQIRWCKFILCMPFCLIIACDLFPNTLYKLLFLLLVLYRTVTSKVIDTNEAGREYIWLCGSWLFNKQKFENAQLCWVLQIWSYSYYSNSHSHTCGKSIIFFIITRPEVHTTMYMHSAHIVSTVCVGIAFKLKTIMKKCMLFYR